MQKKTKRTSNEVKASKSKVYHRSNCNNRLRITRKNRFLSVTLFGRNAFKWGVMITSLSGSINTGMKVILLPDRKTAIKEFNKYLKSFK